MTHEDQKLHKVTSIQHRQQSLLALWVTCMSNTRRLRQYVKGKGMEFVFGKSGKRWERKAQEVSGGRKTGWKGRKE